jgi:molybdopterin/thiamine biosynthesis adenylyltransferase
MLHWVGVRPKLAKITKIVLLLLLLLVTQRSIKHHTKRLWVIQASKLRAAIATTNPTTDEAIKICSILKYFNVNFCHYDKIQKVQQHHACRVCSRARKCLCREE